MKHHYKKHFHWRAKHPGEWLYELETSGYHRAIRTFCEIRRNCADHTDLRGQKIKYRNRSAHDHLDAWNDYPISRTGGKSWKDYTKHRKQWMVARDPKPQHPLWEWTDFGWRDIPWKSPWR